MEAEVKIKKSTGETEVIKYGPQNKYDQTNTVQIKLKLNKKTDADLLEWLETLDNKQGAIKEILRTHIHREKYDKLIGERLRKIYESGVDEISEEEYNRICWEVEEAIK